MTFKEIMLYSRRATYAQLSSSYIDALNHDDYRRASLYYSMMLLKEFREFKHYNRIIEWREAVKSYKFYKNTPKSL